MSLTRVWGSAVALAAVALGRLTGRTVLLVTGHLDAADDAVDDVEVLAGRAPLLLPAWDTDLYAPDHVNDEIAGQRLRICDTLAPPEAGGAPGPHEAPGELIVAPALALLQPVPRPEELVRGRMALRRGQTLSPEDLAGWLVDGGFERVEQVDQQGEFARRGGIVDVLPPGVSEPVRVEFFGDEIDSIRTFDLDTQRSVAAVGRYDITAVATGRQTDPERVTSLAAYLPDDAIVCLPDPEELANLTGEMHRRLTSETDPPPALFAPEEIWAELERFARVEMRTFAGAKADSIELGVRSVERLSYNTKEALAELSKLAQGAELWVFCENEAERKRFGELLETAAPDLAGKLHTGIGHVASGFHWPAEGLMVVGHHEIFHRYAKRRRLRKVRAGRPVESLTDLHEGDYVVHVSHGIARFEGLRQLDREGRTEEYLTLRFAGNAALHVPASRIDLVQKYIAPTKARPTLSKLGSGTWERQKVRVGEATREMAAEMLRIQAMREATPGRSYPATSEWQAQFAAEFIYTETEDQLTTMDAIDRDMARARPMDRLLCGDVGYGKTELAMRAAFKVVEAGAQVAVLVPTTVLAAQHHRTFRERLADYPMRVDMLSRFRKPAEVREVLRRLSTGQIDVLIGTHRLLSEDIRFGDLGLVVIDEEQRFGVEHKEQLKAMRATVEVLTLTATPIPRTLHMALLGLRDISSLTTPPMDRRAIHTEVVHFDERLIRNAIAREMNRQGQVFFVHNRVFDIESVRDRVQKLVPEARIGIGHGQMGARELESTMLRFVRGELDVLVCTTIIESGLDIPTANTMIIHEADMYGLAELHQLRGRVGRYKHLAYCYLLLPETRPIKPVAGKRLKAIEEFSDLGAGFQIAMRDLEIRGAGNILGKAQSGHIAAVGYEMYCQLLENAVGDLTGEPKSPTPEAHLELGIDAYIPRSYIPSEPQRMEVYRRLSRCRGGEDIEQVRTDLADAFGRPPDEVETLLDLAEARIRAAGAGIQSIVRHGPDLIFTVADFERARPVFENAAGSVRLPDAKTAHWRPPPRYLEMPSMLRILLKQLRHD